MELLISLFIAIVIFGLLYWVVESLLPISQPFKNIALAVLVVALIIYLFRFI